MRRSIRSKVAGVSHRNPDGSERQSIIARYCRPGQRLLLIPEYDHPTHGDAVEVWVDTSRGRYQVGYLRAGLVDDVIDHLDAGGLVEVEVLDVTGGGDDQYLGVNIRVDLTHDHVEVAVLDEPEANRADGPEPILDVQVEPSPRLLDRRPNPITTILRNAAILAAAALLLLALASAVASFAMR